MTQPTDPTPGKVPDPLAALVVDDEQPARDELAWLLERDARIGTVRTSASATEALRLLHDGGIDVLFLDIAMPGLSGLELASVLGNFRAAPAVVFVTAHEDHAVEAFELSAVDYLLKPLREERLAEAVRRVLARSAPPSAPPEEQVRVERGGVTRFLPRSSITHVEAQGDYARLHARVAGTNGEEEVASYLVRTPLATLEEQWATAGFVRIHRSLLIALAHVDEVRMEAGRCTVVVAGIELGVSRRHTRGLREVLAGYAGVR